MNKNKERIFSIAAIVIIIDQVIKILITTKMKVEDVITVIPNFFSIMYVKNKGAAFSILQDQKILLVIISLVVLFLLNKYIDRYKDFNKLSIISLGFIIGGIIGNLLDRLIQDGVIDFLSFQFGSYFFPVFNIADSFIVIGVGLLIISIIKEDKKKEELPLRERLSEGVEIIKNDKEDTNIKKKRTKKTTKKKNTKKKS